MATFGPTAMVAPALRAAKRMGATGWLLTKRTRNRRSAQSAPSFSTAKATASLSRLMRDVFLPRERWVPFPTSAPSARRAAVQGLPGARVEYFSWKTSTRSAVGKVSPPWYSAMSAVSKRSSPLGSSSAAIFSTKSLESVEERLSRSTARRAAHKTWNSSPAFDSRAPAIISRYHGAKVSTSVG